MERTISPELLTRIQNRLPKEQRTQPIQLISLKQAETNFFQELFPGYLDTFTGTSRLDLTYSIGTDGSTERYKVRIGLRIADNGEEILSRRVKYLGKV